MQRRMGDALLVSPLMGQTRNFCEGSKIASKGASTFRETGTNDVAKDMAYPPEWRLSRGNRKKP